MRCLLGIALVAAQVAPAAHAKDGRLYLEAAYQHVFFNGEADNTVGGPGYYIGVRLQRDGAARGL